MIIPCRESRRSPSPNRLCGMSNRVDNNSLATLTEQYIAVWNEADQQARVKRIAELWTTEGTHVLVDPPQVIRETAAALNFPTPYMSVRGHRELDARITRAYEMFVGSGTFVFRSRGVAQRLAEGVVGIGWDMVAADGSVGGAGYDVLALDEDGRIHADHQYIGPA